MEAFWCYFRDFVGKQKIEDLTESKTFFAEVVQITSRFVLEEKKLGASKPLTGNQIKDIYNHKHEKQIFLLTPPTTLNLSYQNTH